MKKKRNTSLPSPADLRTTVLELLANSDESLTKNRIARQLDVRGDERIALKQLLAELETEGKIDRGNRRRISVAERLFAVGHVLVVEIADIGEDGELIAAPLDWPSDLPAPKIQIFPSRRTRTKTYNQAALGIGSHVLVRLQSHEDSLWQGEVIKCLEKKSMVHLGIFTRRQDNNGALSPCHRKDHFPGVRLTASESRDLQNGDIVAYAVTRGQEPKIQEKIGSIDDPKTFSRIAIYAHRLPHVFSTEAIALSEQGKIPELGARTDLRDIPLVTIDGEDARDFDDAVWAIADEDPRNPGGWRILVAIADVAYYVRPGDALDREAKDRGNSVYFPDRVVPMLPEALSNELCSLKPHVDRACMAIEMIISADGKIKSHRLKRGLMRSRARLTYTQVQQAIEGKLDEATTPLLDSVLRPLYGAYESLRKARRRRGALDITQTERQVIFGSNGHIERIIPRPQYDSHRLIEEFMIAANVAAARTLDGKGWPCLYRIHDAPDPLRVANLRQVLRKMKIPFTKATKPQPAQFNELLSAAQESPVAQMINDLVLRSQAQARYSPLNIGHYGLCLSQYAHFTSPIRRYADLVVHRSLIGALHLGEGGLPDKSVPLTAVADHISTTERHAAIAEREVLERFVTAYYAPHIGETFSTTIVGVNKAGLFVAIKETGAQGFISRGSLGDFFFYEEDNHRLVGRHAKTVYQLGDHVEARLQSADITMNSLLFEVVSDMPNKTRRKTPPQKDPSRKSPERPWKKHKKIGSAKSK
jgi:ribonuclease R